ncbi:hypothetical protein B835_1226 [Enterococcus mundtii 3F]|nr:hypothetical protein [Enterococcus mundtii 3F]
MNRIFSFLKCTSFSLVKILSKKKERAVQYESANQRLILIKH